MFKLDTKHTIVPLHVHGSRHVRGKWFWILGVVSWHGWAAAACMLCFPLSSDVCVSKHGDASSQNTHQTQAHGIGNCT